MSRIRSRIWELVEVSYAADDHSPVLDWYDAGMMTLILLNVLAVVYVLRRERSAARGVFVDPRRHVAGRRHLYNRRVWRCAPDHAAEANSCRARGSLRAPAILVTGETS